MRSVEKDMKHNIHLTLAICAFFIFAPLAGAQIRQNDGTILAATVPVEARLQGNRGTASAKGTLSLHLDVLSANPAMINVRLLNLVFFNVRQSLISGKKSVRENGVLDIAMMRYGNVQMQYDAKTRTLTGSILVQAHFSQLDEIFPPKFVTKEGKELDFAPSQVQPGSVTLTIQLAEPLENVIVKAQSGNIGKTWARSSVKVEVAQLKSTPSISGYRLDIGIHYGVLAFASKRKFEVVRKLCIQPVRIRDGLLDPAPSGLGLNPSEPQAIVQWRKADVIFTFRRGRTIINHLFKVPGSDYVEEQLLRNIDVPDCVEVFFVENFAPPHRHGGGATWRDGTADAQIITSDFNVRGGRNLTHLAHELGHVLGLEHQETSNNSSGSGIGTLMCASGFLVDNPRQNSQENADNVLNPLLTVTILPIGPPPDCILSVGCGQCSSR
jgi:hypothetical protein